MHGFESDIKLLFRAEDQSAMEWIFDLWSYEDVVEYADDILARLEDGSMPCDAPWEEETVEIFRDWVDGGKAP
ncbi:MAG: hypothetical protein ACRDY7_01645 [Acidimicrobiia bacterium]